MDFKYRLNSNLIITPLEQSICIYDKSNADTHVINGLASSIIDKIRIQPLSLQHLTNILSENDASIINAVNLLKEKFIVVAESNTHTNE
ncbi:hypothetical protein [Thalassotalea agariperforans]